MYYFNFTIVFRYDTILNKTSLNKKSTGVKKSRFLLFNKKKEKFRSFYFKWGQFIIKLQKFYSTKLIS